jgi:CheY-like chemotaxis protein
VDARATRYKGSMAVRVALADDNRVLRMCVRELLVRMDIEVVEAGSGRELAGLLDRERFDAVLADVRMPDGSGLDVLRQRRAAGDATPFVVMTGAADPDVAAAQAVVATRILLKPFARDQLRTALTALGLVDDDAARPAS